MRAGVILFGVFALLAGGCVINESSPPPRGVQVAQPPPDRAPQEVAPPRPAPHAVWVPGYWHWTGMSYAWVPGRWENPPPGSAWRAPSYSIHNGSYFYDPGGWRR